MIVILNRFLTAVYRFRLVFIMLLVLAGGVLVYFVASNSFSVAFENFFTAELLTYVLVGIGAQLIDGTLGMAYGVSSTTFLMSVGVTPAAASAAVHVSEVFTTAASGLSHLRFKNINKKLFRAMVIPGVLGAMLGAYILTNINGEFVKPFVSVYLLIMGG